MSATARGLLVLFEKLGRGQAVDPVADAEMIEILKRQKFRDAIPAGVPAGVAVAHKTGTITRIHHDAGLVYAPRPYVLVVLVRGLQEQKQSAALSSPGRKGPILSTYFSASKFGLEGWMESCRRNGAVWHPHHHRQSWILPD